VREQLLLPYQLSRFQESPRDRGIVLVGDAFGSWCIAAGRC